MTSTHQEYYNKIYQSTAKTIRFCGLEVNYPGYINWCKDLAPDITSHEQAEAVHTAHKALPSIDFMLPHEHEMVLYENYFDSYSSKLYVIQTSDDVYINGLPSKQLTLDTARMIQHWIDGDCSSLPAPFNIPGLRSYLRGFYFQEFVFSEVYDGLLVLSDAISSEEDEDDVFTITHVQGIPTTYIDIGFYDQLWLIT